MKVKLVINHPKIIDNINRIIKNDNDIKTTKTSDYQENIHVQLNQRSGLMSKRQYFGLNSYMDMVGI